jgi:transcriptional regulator with XRE-family HTH domain/tetratricopeptide (TPR) repeat protein
MSSRRARFIERREIVGLSQERLAELVGVSRNTVRRWEAAKSDPQPAQRPSLANALHISLEQLHELLLDIVGSREADSHKGELALSTNATIALVATPQKTPSLGPPEPYAVAGRLTGQTDWPIWFGTRLANLVGLVEDWTGHNFELSALQGLLHREILMFYATGPEDEHQTLSRRQALATLATLATLPLAVSKETSSIASKATAEYFLSRCAASLTACWHLLKGSDLQTVDQVLSTYLVHLKEIAQFHQKHRESAAVLACQAHRILGIIALHRNQLAMREYHCVRALQYAVQTSDIGSRVSALISLASTHFYGANPARAATTYEEASALGSSIAPLQQSRLQAELSVVYGQLGREQDALEATDLAQTLYPRHPEHDPSFLYAEFTPASLALERGLAYLALAERYPDKKYERKAAAAFSDVNHALPGVAPDRIRFEIINHQARNAVLLNDLDAFEAYLRLGAEGASLLESRQRQKEVRAAWQYAIEKWPNERRLQILGEQTRPALRPGPSYDGA